ncbi:MAG: hypothetical protein Q9M14_02310 [Mariprofundaceae bacterium]|nr:hypothetical protein [Mariprofundaceae bacterium]
MQESKMTVRLKLKTAMLVRTNAQCNLKATEGSKMYQSFFTVLEKAMFLTANKID